MWNTANKAALAVSVAVMISGLGLMVYAYARKELISEFEKIRNEYIEKHSDMDEEI